MNNLKYKLSTLAMIFAITSSGIAGLVSSVKEAQGAIISGGLGLILIALGGEGFDNYVRAN